MTTAPSALRAIEAASAACASGGIDLLQPLPSIYMPLTTPATLRRERYEIGRTITGSRGREPSGGWRGERRREPTRRRRNRGPAWRPAPPAARAGPPTAPPGAR